MEWLNKNPAILALIGLFLAQMAMNRAWQNQIEAKFDALSSEVKALQQQVAYNTGVLDAMPRAVLAVQPDASESDCNSAQCWIEQRAVLLLAEIEAPWRSRHPELRARRCRGPFVEIDPSEGLVLSRWRTGKRQR